MTLGPEVAGTATLAGFAPDPEQTMLLDAAFAIDRHGKSVAFEIVVIAPRQNLKTGFEKQYALGQLYVRDESLVVWSAHEFDTSQEAQKDFEALIEGSAELTRMTRRVIHGAVPEIVTMTGARLKFKTRTAGGGRGLSGRKVILDEGFALRPGQMGALMPIMMAQPDPQVLIGSSACRPESSVLWDVVQRGRAGGDPRMVYAEWCAPDPNEACDVGVHCDHARGREGCGCDKRELIELTHSAIARGRILMETVIDLRRTMPPAEYAREVMGWHDDVLDDPGEPALDLVAWQLTEDDDDEAAAAAVPQAFGVEISPDLAFASIGTTCKRADGREFLELVDRRRGSGWLVERCAELTETHGRLPFAIDGKGQAAELIDDLRTAGVQVVIAGGEDLIAASRDLVQDVNDKAIAHGPQDDLDDAVRAARRKDIGDGRFVIARRSSLADISALWAVNLAKWAARADYEIADSIY